MLFGDERDDDDNSPAAPSETSTGSGARTTTPAPGSPPKAGAASGGAPSAGAATDGGQLGDAGAIAAGGVIGSAGEPGAGGAYPCGCADSEICCDDVCVDPESDPANCGGCGHDCLGGQCSAALCQPVLLWQAPEGRTIKDIDADATNVYFLDRPVTNQGFGTVNRIWKIAETGGDPLEFASEITLPQTEITVGGGFVYWAYWTFGNRIRRVPSSGGMVETFTESAGLHCRHMFATEQALYWTNTTTSGAVRAAPHDSAATITTLASDLSGGGEVIVQDDWAFFAYASTLAKVPIGGGDVAPLLTNEPKLGSFAVFGDTVYFGMTTSESVYAMSAAGDALRPFCDTGGSVGELAADPSGLYAAGDGLTRCAHDDGESPVRLHDQVVSTIALSDSFIYLSTGRELFKLAK